ncbi:hypothetical protein [Sphingomonas arenae]|uniref:hypothetical protein n=1 Tax=Sphingomonas arenae TaxID=2812555 RepID=UPI001966ED80|nr:hypothetical protein [Sphingomonas arenae]
MRLIAMMMFAAMSAQLPAADTRVHSLAGGPACSQERSPPQIGAKEGTYAFFAVPAVSL